jgi:hypothetical protein
VATGIVSIKPLRLVLRFKQELVKISIFLFKINFFFMFLNRFDVLILQIIFKNKKKYFDSFPS